MKRTKKSPVLAHIIFTLGYRLIHYIINKCGSYRFKNQNNPNCMKAIKKLAKFYNSLDVNSIPIFDITLNQTNIINSLSVTIFEPGLGSVSPEMTSSKSINFRPFRKSSSMFSIWVPAFRRWELTQAVKVCKNYLERLNKTRKALFVIETLTIELLHLEKIRRNSAAWPSACCIWTTLLASVQTPCKTTSTRVTNFFEKSVNNLPLLWSNSKRS